jgi:SAM-dependent MidA family methyltransferase
MALPDIFTASPDAQAHSQQLCQRIADEINAGGGWLPFERYMELALYCPGLGYYAGGSRKFGAEGDFTTAPEMTPLFATALAAQAEQVMALSAPHIVEAGAGTGRLAADLLLALEARCALPDSYAILELSGELAARQQATLQALAPHLADRVRWLDRLPQHFDGLVLGNELLDAMPVSLLRWQENEILERGVALSEKGFIWAERPAGAQLATTARQLSDECAIPAGMFSEIAQAAPAWVAAWADILGQGALLLLDYGFPRHEFYHPQRAEGTLMCHYRHHSHPDPFFLPGLQDITAHVDFTAIAEAGFNAGLDVLGYTAQSQFLFNCGLLEAMNSADSSSPAYLRQAAAVQKLISPAEMGELFKVIALGRGLAEPLLGFTHGDRLHAL